MERVTGIGGIFLRSADPAATQRWYEQVLGLPSDEAGYTVLHWTTLEGRPASTTWAAFAPDTTYFGQMGQQAMVNYRVPDLDAMLEQLRAAGVTVDDHIEEMEFGRFGWATDLDGRRIELWEPAEGQ